MNDLHFALALAANSLLTIVMFSVFATLALLIGLLLWVLKDE